MFYLPPALKKDDAIRMAKQILLDMSGGKEHPMMEQAIQSFAGMIEGIERYECIKILTKHNDIQSALDEIKRRG